MRFSFFQRYQLFYKQKMHTVTIGQQKVPIKTTDNIIENKLDKVLTFKPFQEWLQLIDKEQQNNKEEMEIHDIHIQSIDEFGSGNIGFVKFKVNIQYKTTGKNAPGIVFMRGGAVSILLILESDDETKEDKTILTLQPRIPVPHFNFPELPAGMLDSNGNFAGTAAKELYEETGLKIKEKELIDLTELAYGDQWKGVYPSAGGCDEFLRLFLCRKKMKQQDIDDLEGKLTGLRHEGEQIKLKIVPLKDAWKQSCDMKLLSSLTLYNSLKNKIIFPN